MKDDRISSAFAEIRADDALLDNTAAYLHRELGKRLRKNKRIVIPRLAGAFAAMAVFVVGIVAYSLYFTADAYVSIDVNPSVEWTLNRFDKVIATLAFNEDGERILSEAGLRGKSCDEAVGLVVAAIESGGYLTEDVLVSVTVQAADSGKGQLLCDQLRQSIAGRIASAQPTAAIEIFPVTAEVWQGAHGCHMSPARYLAIQELMEVDEEATMEAYGDSPIRQIRRRTQECRGAHSPEPDSGEPAPAPSNRHGHGRSNGNGHRGGH